MQKQQLDLLDYLNKLLQQDAEAKRKAEQIYLEPADDFDDDDDDDEYDCDQGPEEDEHGNWTDWREESDDDWEDDEEEPAKLSNVIQNFVNKCAKADRLPTLEEAQTIAILHSIIK